MAEGKTGPPDKKPALSGRIMQMKFMQRGKDKAVAQEAVKEQAKTEEEEEWVATVPAGQLGCVILVEGNPPPGAHMGHMSFNSFNPELEKLQEDRASLLQSARKTAAVPAEGKVVSDTDMADRMQQIRSTKADDRVMKSIRGNKPRSQKSEKSSSSRTGNKRKRHKPSQ